MAGLLRMAIRPLDRVVIHEMPPDQNGADSCRQILEANNLVQIDYPYPISRNQILVKDGSQSNNEV